MDRVSIMPFHGKSPKIDPTAWIAPGCSIIGDVEIGPGASIWFNCVLRGDANAIRIGARSNIQDGSVIHCDAAEGGSPGYPTLIGDDVLVGHMAMLHGCTLMSGSFVGIGAIAMDGSVIEGGGMLAAGAMLTPNKHIGPNELWTGRPARLLRTLGDADVARNRRFVTHYAELAQEYRQAAS